MQPDNVPAVSKLEVAPPHKPNHPTTTSPPIVGMGASAGGLEAFEDFFRHVSINSGMAFVLVSHLDPDHASLLTEILQRVTALPVVEAVDHVQVEANCVYVIPPNRDMAIFHGKLQLSVPSEPRGLRMPIDAFLRSLAEDQQENAIGIILSGTGTDGTLGLRAILGAGGITLVQEPATAKYDGMPDSAIQAGYATHILPVEKMPAALLAGVRLVPNPIETPAVPAALNGINHILMQLRTVTGHDFSLYKKSTISRRIERRMSLHAIEDIDVYARYLKENPAEAHILFKELLINVTCFFRDPEAFIELETHILPLLRKDKPSDAAFRVWVAGGSSGEEAYSIAILLRELMTAANQKFNVQIYSTDLDDEVIDFARIGLYPPNIAQDITPERLRRFFTKEDAGFRVKKDIREMVVFAVQNVIKDPPFTRLDLLSCRNLMIYMEPELQKQLLSTFHYALKPTGVLFLSPSESIGNHTELFSAINRKWKFYCATHSIASARAIMAHGVSWDTENTGKTLDDPKNKPKGTNLAELTRRLLVQFFAPASILTDFSGNIIYVYGETGKYLRPAPGQASLNVVEMARDGLEMELRNAVLNVAREGVPTLGRELLVKTNGGFTAVSLSVRPLPNQVDNQNLLLISFQDVAAPAAKPARKRLTRAAEQGRIQDLEHELAYLKENYQAMIEEQQASNEELKSTNEEMQSTNEELQSTNEELETSKEELQSVNEELITVNAELQNKIEQLAYMQNDMKNLLDNISIGVIFLDQHLIIRSFTREAKSIYRLVASDVGRPLNDIKAVCPGNDDLLTAAQTVLRSLIPYEHEMLINGGILIQVRILPYRTLDNIIDGVVLTFTDITARISAARAKEALQLTESIVNTVHEPFIVLDGGLKVISASRSFYHEFQVTPENTVGRRIYELGDKQWDIADLRKLLENILQDGQAVENYAMANDFPVIGHRKLLLNAHSVISKRGDALQLILLSMDVV